MASADSFGKVGKQVGNSAQLNANLNQAINKSKPDNFFGTVISDGAGITGGASVQRPITAPGGNTADLGGENNSQQHTRSGADQVRHQAYLQQNGTKRKLPPPQLNRKKDQESVLIGKGERSNDQFILGFNNKGASFSPFGNGFRT